MSFERFRLPGAIALLIILILLTACATPQINITADGTPIPEHITRLSNPGTEIAITVSLVRQFMYTEGDESVMMPEYLQLDQLHRIDQLKTKGLIMAIHVHNPKRVEYQVWESHDFWYPNSKWPTHVTRCFYQGRMSTRDYRVNLPLKDIIKGKSRVEVRDPETNEVIMSIGDAIYELKGGANRQ